MTKLQASPGSSDSKHTPEELRAAADVANGHRNAWRIGEAFLSGILYERAANNARPMSDPNDKQKCGTCGGDGGAADGDANTQESACSTCGGKGYVYEGEAITGRGPDDVFPEQVACEDCAPRADEHQFAPGALDAAIADAQANLAQTPQRYGGSRADGSAAEVKPDTGHAEADRVIGRLASSDPDFDDCTDAAVLIRQLVVEHRGPDGFATWKDAAVAERLKARDAASRVAELERALVSAETEFIYLSGRIHHQHQDRSRWSALAAEIRAALSKGAQP